MYQDRFFYLLNQLTTTEFKQFRRWFNTLSENRRKRSLVIANKSWAFFEPYRTSETPAPRETVVIFKKTLYNTLHPKSLYNNITMNKYLHQLSTLLEEFLIVLEVQENKLKRQEMLMSIAQSRNMTDEYFSKIDQQKRTIEKASERSFHYHYKQFELAYLSFFHPETQKHKHKYEGFVPQVVLTQAIHDLDAFYWIAKYRLLCAINNRMKLYGECYNLEHLHASQTSPSQSNIVLTLYQKIFLFYQTPSLALYHEIKALAFQHIGKLDNMEQNNLLVYLYNIQGILINQNRANQNLIQDVLEIAKFGFENGILGKKMYIAETFFIGLFQITSTIDADWSKFLLQQYQHLLAPEKRKNTINLCKVIEAFYRKDFDNANQYLQLIHYDNFTYLIRARAYQLMCYVELRASLTVDIPNYATNFIRHLRNNKLLNEDIKISFINFAKIVQRIIDFEPDFDAIEQDIHQTSKIIAKNWLIEKINDFRK